jgi:hypothetical protein
MSEEDKPATNSGANPSAADRLRTTAQEVMNLNLGDLDIKELEQRLSVLRHLQDAQSLLRPPAPEPDCGTFECGYFRGTIPS